MKDVPTPDSLGPGSIVGPWRIEGYAGRGTYGLVFRARLAGHPDSPLVALKVAAFAYDPRFVREAALLSRLHHPSIPKLLGQGWWVAGPEAAHPYIVMEWIPGMPLYAWAREHQATPRQVLRVLAQVAGALESLMPPNTREYRSPEAYRFEWSSWRRQEARYRARPADDLHALGVSLYRLVTGAYPPPPTEPQELKEQREAPPPRRLPAHERNERVVPELSALIERLLSNNPKARGAALEMEEAAEATAEQVGPLADVAMLHVEQPVAESVEVAAVSVRVRAALRAHATAWRRGLAAAALLFSLVGSWWLGHTSREPSRELPDAAPTALGDDGLSAPQAAQDAPRPAKAISQPMPKEPLPGQRRPPCDRGEVALQGGCWIQWPARSPPCGEETYEWKGICYVPRFAKQRVPTTQQPQ